MHQITKGYKIAKKNNNFGVARKEKQHIIHHSITTTQCLISLQEIAQVSQKHGGIV